ncbi:HIT family protein [Marinicella sp. W31]|uniref:HIT family protein n=1 Tax=Marinicella sp. W31 TaxID=3023713 RepID=UPI003757B854
MTHFQIDPQLLQDTHSICAHRGFHILLHRNASIPWFIVVPETTAVELYQLSSEQSKILQFIQSALGDFLQQGFHAEKINIAAIGNIVRQLHVHVIGRFEADPCWPGVVWGADYAIKEYVPEQLEKIKKNLQKQFY